MTEYADQVHLVETSYNIVSLDTIGKMQQDNKLASIASAETIVNNDGEHIADIITYMSTLGLPYKTIGKYDPKEIIPVKDVVPVFVF